MASAARTCTKCSKTVFPLDDKISAEGGIWHKPCFKCTACNGQLTLLSFAQIKGTLYCKPHFIELFKRRGKYDDLAPNPTTAGTHHAALPHVAEDATAATTTTDATPAVAVDATATVSEQPVHVDSASHAAEPAATGGGETFITGMSVKERIAAAMKNSEAASPPVAVAPRRASTVKVAAANVEAPAAAAVEAAPVAAAPVAAAEAPVAAAEAPVAAPVAAAETSSDASSSRPAASAHAHASSERTETFITGLSVKDRIAAASAGNKEHVAAPVEHVAATPAPAPAPAAPAPAPVPAPAVTAPHAGDASSEPAGAKKVSKFGGGAVSCAACSRSIYPADPQIGNDGSVWHRECFKCSHCKGQLNIKGMAVFEGQLFCKPHFISLFKLKGKYDTLKGGETGAAASGAEETVAAVPVAAGAE